MNTPILDPKIELLKAEIEELRRKFLTLYTQKESMIYNEYGNLHARYLKEIGQYQYENYQLQVEARALKRKVELAQSYINRNQKPNYASIDIQVKNELKEYYEKIEQQQKSLEEAKTTKTISNFDMKEMHDIYRVLVKRLHPDLNPDNKEKCYDQFVKVQAAYHKHNINLLREIIMHLQMDEDIDTLVNKSDETLEDMKIRLQEQISEIEHDIAYMLTTYPFTMRHLLEDPEALAKKKEDINQERGNLIEQIRIYTERYQLMTNN